MILNVCQCRLKTKENGEIWTCESKFRSFLNPDVCHPNKTINITLNLIQITIRHPRIILIFV